MSFNQQDLSHVLKLAYLNIPESEHPHYVEKVSAIIQYMKHLDAFDLTDIEPSSHALGAATYLREDIAKNQPDLLLKENAPDWENGCFKVPKIMDTPAAAQ